MGFFRCVSKPIKRFLFSCADSVADNWKVIVVEKYTKKFTNKRIKLNLDNELTQTSDVPGLNIFLANLQNDLNKEKGLAHSKVREYWLRRGPRLLLVLILTIIITLGLAYLLIEPSRNDQILSILIGFNMIIFNIYLLYQRLIDAISGAMMRIGHDHYTKWKSELITI